MTPFLGAILLISLLAILGQPIGHAMIAGSILYMLTAGLDPGTVAEQLLNGLYGSYVLLAIPLFILAAELMNVGTLSARLLLFCNALVGRFRGGLGHVNVVSSLIFSGMSGSAIADAAGIGRITTEMMCRDGRYSRSYAAALTAASAVIGPIIPPSIPLVLYALVADASIGYLFLAGVLPGLLIGLLLAVMNGVLARLHRFPVEPAPPAAALPGIALRALPVLLMPVILLYGIYSGVTTPTEAAAIAAAYALLISVLLYRALKPRQLYGALLRGARATAALGLLIAGAMVFNYIFAVENIPNGLRRYFEGGELTALQFLLIVNVILLLLGCLLEGGAILLVVVPIFTPTASALGIDPVHFGIVVVVNIMIGLVTPPYGLLLFVVGSIAKAPLGAIVRDIFPFLAMLLLALAAVTLLPDLVLWLPRLYGYGG